MASSGWCSCRSSIPSGQRGGAARADLNGGGVLIDGGIHKLSAVAYLVGQPTEVYAREVLPGQPGLEAEDGVVVITRDAGGVVGMINHSWSVVPPQPALLGVDFGNGRVPVL